MNGSLDSPLIYIVKNSGMHPQNFLAPQFILILPREAFLTQQAAKSNLLPPTSFSPLPKVDAEYLFWTMMGVSRNADPWMFPALVALKKSKQYILAALSNTVIFPPSHPYSNTSPSNNGHENIRDLFDVFVSSAHVGLRKPDARIYDLALKEVNAFAKAAGKGEVDAGDVLFLDDIGENLKAGKKKGFRTLKVGLGRAFEAVDELERITGLELAGNHPKVAIEPKYGKAKL